MSLKSAGHKIGKSKSNYKSRLPCTCAETDSAIISGFSNLSELPIPSQAFFKKKLSCVNKAKLLGPTQSISKLILILSSVQPFSETSSEKKDTAPLLKAQASKVTTFFLLRPIHEFQLMSAPLAGPPGCLTQETVFLWLSSWPSFSS